MENYMANPNTYYVKQNVNHREYFMQKYVYQLDIVNVPEIIEYNDKSKMYGNEESRKIIIYQISMEKMLMNCIELNYLSQVIKIVRTLVLH